MLLIVLHFLLIFYMRSGDCGRKSYRKLAHWIFFLSTSSSGNQTLPKKSKSKTKKTAILFVSIVNSQKCTTTNIVVFALM